MVNKKNKKKLNNTLDSFLDEKQEGECTTDECLVKTDKSLVERINKKIITTDGRQLLM